MHCKFQDVDSGRALEVVLSLDQDGKMSQSDAEQDSEKLESSEVL